MPRERVRHGCEQSGRGEEGEEPPPPPAESYEVGWQHAFSAAEEGGALLDRFRTRAGVLVLSVEANDPSCLWLVRNVWPNAGMRCN